MTMFECVDCIYNGPEYSADVCYECEDASNFKAEEKVMSKNDKLTCINCFYQAQGLDIDPCSKCVNGSKIFITLDPPEDLSKTAKLLIRMKTKQVFGEDDEADDPVNHPAHYTTGKIEVIDFIEDKQLGFHEGNVIKYICRAKLKGQELQDLKKARWYLDRLISRIDPRPQ